ncbi:MAG: tRNA 2-thiouridine(34) synthase MnmA [Prevotella sp.]|nr:tRNA 2-thiouridine(34) synthase MnmA [Prevotella sp.]
MGLMKALIAMSGGVDSSVAALLVKQQNWDGIGCTMKLYANEDALVSREKSCCSLDDVADARSVANRLQMPYYVFNFTADFQQKVIQKFIDSYERGVTPNPCIDCNRYMKFDKLYARAQILGCDYLVTGHYARIEKIGDQYYLKKAVDKSKDQSYVLYHLTAAQLAHTWFPLGELTKTQVRELARAHGFVNADKHESQDICFVPHGDYAAVIEHHTGKTYPAGNFVDQDGQVLGRHRGIIHYTVGQRKGLAVSADRRLYVRSICPADNTVCLCDRDALLQANAVAVEFHWINGVPSTQQFRCQVKIRYNQKEQPATVTLQGDDRVQITFDQPQRAVTPGQAAVLYQGDIVLGGGVLIG